MKIFFNESTAKFDLRNMDSRKSQLEKYKLRRESSRFKVNVHIYN